MGNSDCQALSQQVILQHVASLELLKSDSCKFAHENSDRSDVSDCADGVKENILGCAHSCDARLLAAIHDLQNAGILPADEAADMRKTLEQTQRPLLDLDMRAIHEYEETGDLQPETIADHELIIGRKNTIRHRLLNLLVDRVSH